MKKNNNRLEKYDTAKAIAIILMVYAHAAGPSWISRFINLFHVSFFFILAGWFYQPSVTHSLGQIQHFIFRKIQRIWLPFVIWTAAFILLNNVFLDLNIYTDNAEFLTSGTIGREFGLMYRLSTADMLKQIIRVPFMITQPQIGVTLWFLQTLFYALIGYCLLSRLCRAKLIILSIVTLCLCIVGKHFLQGFLDQLGSLRWFPRILTAILLIHFGVIFRSINPDVLHRLRQRIHPLFIILGSLVLLISFSFVGGVGFIGNVYPSVLFLISVSTLGWILICKTAELHWFGAKILSIIGQQTMSILILHFLAFKLVNWGAVTFLAKPKYLIAAQPTLYNGIGWSILYTAIGITMPILLNSCWHCILRTVAPNSR